MFPRVVTGTLLGVLLILGAFAWRQHQALVALEQDVRPLSGLRRANVQLVTENAALRERVRERSAGSARAERNALPALDPGFAGQFGNLRLVAEAKARGLVFPVYFSAAAPFTRLSMQFINTFELTPAEIAALKERLAEAERNVNALTAANTTVVRESDTSLTITIRPTMEGTAVREDLRTGFRATLGEERYRYFQQLAAEQFERCLGSFGTEGRTFTIKRNATGPSRYMVEERGKASSREPHESTRTNFVADRQKLEAQFANFAKLLPPDL
jgi:hypothetical protein